MNTPRSLYHAARRVDRASIEQHGLLGVGRIGSPRRTKWNIAGQRAGLYLSPTVVGAQAYIAHYHDRFLPWWRSTNPVVRNENVARLLRAGANFASVDWDIWEVTLLDEELLIDADWIADAYCVIADIPPARIRRIAEWNLADEGALAAGEA